MRSSWALWLGAIVTGAFVVRLLYVFELRDTLFFHILVGDGREYDRWAREIAGGQWVGTGAFYQSPLYPYLLAVIYAVIGHHVFAVRLLQAVAGAFACGLLGVAGRRFFSPAAGLSAAALLAIYPSAIFFDGLIQKSSLDVFLMAALLALIGGLLTKRPWPALVATGLVVGLVMLNRENARILFPVVVIWMWVAFRQSLRTRLVQTAILTSGVVLVLAPVLIRNVMVSGEWLISTSQLGTNFYIGNHTGATGTYQSLLPERGDPRYERLDATELAQSAAGRALTASEVSDYWLDRAVADIRQAPGAWLVLLARKTGFALQASEIVDTESVEAFANAAPVLRALRWLGFGLMMPLAVAGVWLTRQDARRLMILYVSFGALVASIATFYVVSRYRLPIVPIVLLFAGAAIAALPELRHRSMTDWLPGVAAGIVVAVLIHLPSAAGRASDDSTYYNYGETAVEEGHATEAIPYLEQAVAGMPDPASALTVLGAAYRQTHDTERALASLTEAVRRRPESAPAQYSLGLTLDDAGRTPEAQEHLAAAVRLGPASAAYHADHGAVLSRLGRFDDATTEFRAALRLDASSADVHQKLAVALAQTNRLADAIQEFRVVIHLSPGDADAHGNLALALAMTGDMKGAEDEYSTALRIAPANVGIVFNHARLLQHEGRRDEARAAYAAAAELARAQNRPDLVSQIEAAMRTLK